MGVALQGLTVPTRRGSTPVILQFHRVSEKEPVFILFRNDILPIENVWLQWYLNSSKNFDFFSYFFSLIRETLDQMVCQAEMELQVPRYNKPKYSNFFVGFNYTF